MCGWDVVCGGGGVYVVGVVYVLLGGVCVVGWCVCGVEVVCVWWGGVYVVWGWWGWCMCGGDGVCVVGVVCVWWGWCVCIVGVVCM